MTSEVDAILREVQWRVLGFDRRNPHQPLWTLGLENALSQALLTAQTRGSGLVMPADMLHGLLGDTENAACGVLAQLGVRRIALLVAAKKADVGEGGNHSRAPIADMLTRYGLVSEQGESGTVSLVVRAIRYVVTRAAEASPVLADLEFEAVRQAVRLGHRQVNTAHLLLAVFELDRQLAIAGVSFVEGGLKGNRAGSVLRENGLTRDGVLEHVSTIQCLGDAATPRRRRELRTKQKHPEWTQGAADAADHSRMLARQGNEDAGSLHLLFSSLRDSAGCAPAVVRALGSDPVAILRDTEQLLRNN
ncbi:MAG: hypothetical protein HKP61_10810 [Dactylosporangium sp.]|nr:hypothetical protein [Dactylosporangium sp.]NNJ61419.1 hypothetical protein [Dactylosporangium sp.]